MWENDRQNTKILQGSNGLRKNEELEEHCLLTLERGLPRVKLQE